MEFPPSYQYDLRLHLETSPHQHRQQSPLPWNLFPGDASAESFVRVPAEGQDEAPPQPLNVLFEPSCDDLDLVPGLAPATTKAAIHGTDLMFNLGVEHKSKRLKGRDVYENNSRVTPVDYLQPGDVSAGLCLSLGFNHKESLEDSALLPLSLDEIEEDLQQQDEEIYRFIDHEMGQLRQRILDKVHGSKLQAAAFVGGRYLHKLHQKDAEIEILNKRNKELEDRLKQLTYEVGAWQQHARHNENVITALHVHLMKAYAQGEGEGCGDSEDNDAASFNIGGPYSTRQSLACRACGVSRACMVVDPCRHLCLCKDCERELSFCPLCQTSKSKGVEVYLP